MGFRPQGEIVGDLGETFRVVPVQKWMDTDMFEQAAMSAAAQFQAAGALLPVDISSDDCIVQEYPNTSKLLFLFARMIRGREHFYPYIWTLSPEMVSALVNAGRWERTH